MSNITVDILRVGDIDNQVLEQTCRLLKQLHSQSAEYDSSDLADECGGADARIAVARDKKEIVGMGVLKFSDLLGHTDGTVRCLAVKKGYDPVEVRFEIIKKLSPFFLKGTKTFINILPDDPLVPRLKEFGFQVDPKIRLSMKG